MSYLNLGGQDRACEDLQKACELGECAGLNWAEKKGYCFVNDRRL
jgi:hypothetical protein